MLLKYASIVKTSCENILEMMEILRMNAVKKLAARGKFHEKGIATLKLRICANCESLVRCLVNLKKKISDLLSLINFRKSFFI